MEGLTPEKMKTASKSAQEESEPVCKRRRAAMAHTPPAPRAASVERADAAAPPVVVVASVPAATKGKRVKRQTIGPGAPEPTGGGVARAAESSDDDFEMGETLSEEERARRAKAKAEREGNVQDISDDDSDVEDALTPFEQRILVYYKEFATSDEGLDINAVAAGLGTTTFQVRSAVYFLEGQGELYSTIDEDHHKSTE